MSLGDLLRKIARFHLVALATAALGLVVAVVALLGHVEWALALIGLTLSLLTVLVVVGQRRTIGVIRKTAKQARAVAPSRSPDIDRQALTDLTVQIDAMQRRVVASIDAARLEAADRHTALHAEVGREAAS